MKKIFFASLVSTIFFAFLFFFADEKIQIKKIIRQGNEQYGRAEFSDALQSFEAGLELNPRDKILNFNAAQTAYFFGDFEKAAALFKNSDENAEKFLRAGNANFKLGEENDDIKFFSLALDEYKAGIKKFPQNIPLKFNYEKVSEMIKNFPEEENDSENSDENEKNDDDEQEAEQQDAEQQDSEQQDSEQLEQSDENDDDDSSRYEENDEDENGDGEDMQAIEQILRILEQQEEESLKNNQELIRRDDGTNAW